MIRPRAKPDGLPFRVYERRGVRTYSIGHKAQNGTWTFKLRCAVGDARRIAELRREAIDRWNKINAGAPAENTIAALIDAWFAWQRSLPPGTVGKRAESTLAENEREAVRLKAGFRDFTCDDPPEKGDAYEYLDACLIARDKEGNLRPRPEKGNKEIALLRTIFEWGVRVRALKANPFENVEKLKTVKYAHAVAPEEMALAVEVGRKLPAQQHLVALALKTAWLCVKRSVEVRAMTRDQIGEAGIMWRGAKRSNAQVEKLGLIEWSDELRATVDEALAIKRRKLAGSWYVFGNLDGQRYTKGGWKKTLSVLMAACVVEAEKRRIAFRPFSLQDCRPKGVSDKLARGDADTVDAAMHSSERMIRQVYDRRRVRVAKPAG